MLAEIYRHLYDLEAGQDLLNLFLKNLNYFSLLKFTNTTSLSKIVFLDKTLKIIFWHITSNLTTTYNIFIIVVSILQH